MRLVGDLRVGSLIKMFEVDGLHLGLGELAISNGVDGVARKESKLNHAFTNEAWIGSWSCLYCEHL